MNFAWPPFRPVNRKNNHGVKSIPDANTVFYKKEVLTY